MDEGFYSGFGFGIKGFGVLDLGLRFMSGSEFGIKVFVGLAFRNKCFLGLRVWD